MEPGDEVDTQELLQVSSDLVKESRRLLAELDDVLAVDETPAAAANEAPLPSKDQTP